ncbi:MAG: hypothetical protein ACLGG7_08300 [Bacteriovoracia bacterium]
MPRLILILGLLLGSSALSAQSWETLQSDPRLKLYRLKNNSEVYVSITRRADERIPQFTKDSSKSTLALLLKQRAQAMELVGVRDWTATSSAWSADAKRLEIRGHYTDHKARAVEFVEYHAYEGETSVQTLAVAPKSQLSAYAHDIAELLKHNEGNRR